MQLCVIRGQRLLPWCEQGRHDRAESCTTLSQRPVGANPSSGEVGPKIATTGVPTAWARCIGAESLVTASIAVASPAAASRIHRCPARSAKPCTAGLPHVPRSRNSPIATTFAHAVSSSTTLW